MPAPAPGAGEEPGRCSRYRDESRLRRVVAIECATGGLCAAEEPARCGGECNRSGCLSAMYSGMLKYPPGDSSCSANFHINSCVYI